MSIRRSSFLMAGSVYLVLESRCLTWMCKLKHPMQLSSQKLALRTATIKTVRGSGVRQTQTQLQLRVLLKKETGVGSDSEGSKVKEARPTLMENSASTASSSYATEPARPIRRQTAKRGAPFKLGLKRKSVHPFLS